MTKRLVTLSALILAACSGTQTPTNGSSSAGDGGGAVQAGSTSTGDAGSTGETTGAAASTSGAGGAAASTGSGGPEPQAQTPAQLVSAGDAANGAKLYEENHCKGCHGTPEKPGKKFPNVFKADYGDKKIEDAFAIIKKGKSPMPGFGDKLDDKAIADLVAYFKSKK